MTTNIDRLKNDVAQAELAVRLVLRARADIDSGAACLYGSVDEWKLALDQANDMYDRAVEDLDQATDRQLPAWETDPITWSELPDAYKDANGFRPRWHMNSLAARALLQSLYDEAAKTAQDEAEYEDWLAQQERDHDARLDAEELGRDMRDNPWDLDEVVREMEGGR